MAVNHEIEVHSNLNEMNANYLNHFDSSVSKSKIENWKRLRRTIYFALQTVPKEHKLDFYLSWESQGTEHKQLNNFLKEFLAHKKSEHNFKTTSSRHQIASTFWQPEEGRVHK